MFNDVDAEVVIGTIPVGDISYSDLLIILRNNRLAALDDGHIVSITRETNIRQLPTRTIYSDDDSIDDGEFVSRVIQLENTEAKFYVPIFRPMLPQHGFMVAHAESSSLLIFDRYGNVRRISEIIEKMDASAK